MSAKSNNEDGTITKITLFERENGERSMKFGEHEATMYMNDDNRPRQESAEVVELDEPAHPDAFQEPSDFPERVQEFFGVGGDE